MTFFFAFTTGFALLCVSLAVVIASDQSADPSVALDNGAFIGVSQGSVNLFLGIPFAQPPMGDLRFRLPVANEPYNGTYDATVFGPSCIIQNITNIDPLANHVAQSVLQDFANRFQLVGGDSEDCLLINVFVPSNATSDSKLPVIFYIFGGGFEAGTSAIYNGSVIVERSIELGVPAIYVSINHRLSALGFSGSAEVREAGIGNLGLHDQRQALRWVQKYIGSFGGDPSKVMIWGESSGAISVSLQMLTNNGDTEGLFRTAFMNSGSVLPVGELEGGQVYFNQFVSDAGCVEYLGSTTVFDCLRNVPIETIRAAINRSPGFLGSYQGLYSVAWLPRVDGVFLTALPERLLLEGSVADVPFVTGNCDDEGTVFSLSNSNVTTNDELIAYLAEFVFKGASASEINETLSFYPEDPAQGSPFDTGDLNAITPEYKRISAFLGDFFFQAPRRLLLEYRSGEQDTYSFLSKRAKSTNIIGSYHSSDLMNVYGPGDMTDYLVRFAANLDPNGNTGITWPRYSIDSPLLLTFLDGPTPLELTNDTYRAEGMKAVTNLSLAYPS